MTSWSTQYSEAVVNESYHNSAPEVSSGGGGLKPLYSLVNQFTAIIVGDGDSPSGLNATALLGSPEKLQLEMLLSEHSKYIAAVAGVALSSLLALSLTCCCHCIRGTPKPQLFKETAAVRCNRLTIGAVISALLLAALGTADSAFMLHQSTLILFNFM